MGRAVDPAREVGRPTARRYASLQSPCPSRTTTGAARWPVSMTPRGTTNETTTAPGMSRSLAPFVRSVRRTSEATVAHQTAARPAHSRPSRKCQGHAPDADGVKVEPRRNVINDSDWDAGEPRAEHAVGAQRRTLDGVAAGAHHGVRDGRSVESRHVTGQVRFLRNYPHNSMIDRAPSSGHGHGGVSDPPRAAPGGGFARREGGRSRPAPLSRCAEPGDTTGAARRGRRHRQPQECRRNRGINVGRGGVVGAVSTARVLGSRSPCRRTPLPPLCSSQGSPASPPPTAGRPHGDLKAELGSQGQHSSRRGVAPRVAPQHGSARRRAIDRSPMRVPRRGLRRPNA